MKLIATAGAGWLVCIAVSGCAAALATAPSPSVPQSLQPPAGQKLKLKLLGRGVQIYQCQDGAWKLQGPDARLTDAAGHVVGKHYAGPTWESTDGSKVVGEVRAHQAGPDPGAVPWLLLSAKSVSGNGVFGSITSIQRLQTTGGQAPHTDCSGKQTVQVTYSALYYFYAAN